MAIFFVSELGGQKSTGHTYHCPDSVLLADVVRTGAERFLATNREATSIHQVTEKLPT